MAKHPVHSEIFDQLLFRINQETCLNAKKLDILEASKGYFSGDQAGRILYALPDPTSKLRAICIMEPRLCRMTCFEATDILNTVSIPSDKLRVLQCLKKYLVDCQTTEGKRQIAAAFVFESDKHNALNILHTVRSDIADVMPAGGHQGYASLGSLYQQAPPLQPHLYGSLEEQRRRAPGHGEINLPVYAQPDAGPSIYTGHPSYSYPKATDYATARGLPGNILSERLFFPGDKPGECPMKPPVPIFDQPLPEPRYGLHPGCPESICSLPKATEEIRRF